jgi:hypothetical protein
MLRNATWATRMVPHHAAPLYKRRFQESNSQRYHAQIIDLKEKSLSVVSTTEKAIEFTIWLQTRRES